MKIVKVRTDLVFLVTPIILLCGFLSLWLWHRELSVMFYSHWFALAICALLILTPWGNTRLQSNIDTRPRQPVVQWLAQLFALQFCVTAVYFGISLVSGQTLPVMTSTHEGLFIDSLTHLLTTWGLFPWAFIALMSITMGIYSYRRNRDSYVSTTLQPLLKSDPQQPGGLIVNTLAKLGTLMVFAISFAFMSLLLASLFNGTVESGFRSSVLLITMVILVITLLSPFRHYLSRQISHQRPLFTTLIILCVILALVLIALNLILGKFFTGTAPIPTVVKNLLKQDWMTSWMLFSAIWWVVWTPVLGAMCARLSRGYSTRATLLGILVFPSLAAVFFNWLHAIHYSVIHSHTALNAIAAFVGFIGLTLFLTNRSALPMTVLSYLPAGDRYKHRDPHGFVRKMLQLSAGLLYLYLPSGLQVSYILVFAMGLPLMVLALLQTIASVVLTVRK